MQHGRLSNIEIDGIPANIGDDRKQLEVAAIKILNAINVRCSPEDIESIHRLPAKTGIKPTIIKFLSRKTAENSLENKGKLKHLKDLNIDINGLNDDSHIYLRPSLSPYYRKIAYNCRILKRHQLTMMVVAK